MTQTRILIVEDDLEIREFVSLYLSKHDFCTIEAADGRTAITQFDKEQPDLVLLDVLLPNVNGLDVCKHIRRHSDVPIIFLSCKWEADDVVKGLELGGDDYVTKPFEPQVLLARIRANLRRTNEHRDSLEFGPLHIDLQTFEVRVNGEPVVLYAKELQLLLFLAQNPNRVFSIEELYDKIWNNYGDGDTRTVMVHISNLRRKIECDPANPSFIRTMRGFGYKFEV